MTRVTRLGLLLLGALLSFSLLAAPQFPALSGRVVDEAHLLSPEQANRLTGALATFEQKSGVQLVVVSLTSLDGNTIEEYGYQLGRHWGIGQKGKNNGVLLIISPEDRKVRIEVGYGLEGVLPDAIAANIIQTRILPEFRRGDMAAGILGGSQAIMQALAGEYQAKAPPKKDKVNGLLIFIIMVIAMIVLHNLRGGGGGGSGRGRRSAIYTAGGFGAGRSGGGFGGGSFGGGGGSFGGGGASGGW